MSTTPNPPTKLLSDIIVIPDDTTKKEIHSYVQNVMGAGSQTMIINDWLFLGNCQMAMDIQTLQKFGITHVLNCTQHIPCFHVFNDIEYARIPLHDMESANIYDYFEAACAFIDKCNPFYYHQNEEVLAEMMADLDWNPPKILVHCAAGMSRSATIVICYLIRRTIRMNDIEKNKVQFIAEELHYINNKKPKKVLTLSEAFYYVKSCRSIVQPNPGFLEQLDRFEQLYQNGHSTKQDIDIISDIAERARHVKLSYKRTVQTSGNGKVEQKWGFCAIL